MKQHLLKYPQIQYKSARLSVDHLLIKGGIPKRLTSVRQLACSIKAAWIDQCLTFARVIRKYGAVRSLYRAPLFTIHTDWSTWLSRWHHSLNEDIHKQHPQNCSRVTSWTFYRLIWVKLASYHTHRTVNVFTATLQNKSSVKLERHCDRNILILFSRMYLLLG